MDKLFLLSVVVMGILFFIGIIATRRLEKQIKEQRLIIDDIKEIINGSRQEHNQETE